MNAGTVRRSASEARIQGITRLKRALPQAVVEYLLECIAAAHRICDGQAEPLRLTGDQALCFFLRELRSVEADTAATDRCIGAATEREIELDGVLDARHRQFRMSDEMRAARLVTYDDHVRLTAV